MKIEFDDDDQGGFTVVEGGLKEVPYGWEEISPGRFEPKWPQCRYRRLSKQSVRGRIFMISHCHLFKQVVTFDTCAKCDQHKPPYEYIEMTPELAEQIKVGRIDSVPIEHMITEPDPVFLPTLDESQPIPWLPCKHRYDDKGENDCCIKPHCGNETCPKFGEKVRKRICKQCEHREE